jgi:hypothetical protein
MSDALQEFIKSGVYEPRPVRMARASSLRWSGAAILGGKLSIVTVSKDEDGDWDLDVMKSREFKLDQRKQSAATMLHSNVSGFLRRARITRIFLRVGSSRGSHSGKAESYICEGLLYMAAGVEVHHLSAFGLAPWMNQRGLELGRESRRGWHLACAAALYAAEHAQDLGVGNRAGTRRRAAR